MATGAGKTRTVIALCDLLMRCNWVKRVLFLADRVALVRQAVNAFKAHLPSSAPVNLVTEKNTEGRVYVSTYPTMMGFLEDTADGERKFGVGHFDMVIIDEAHNKWLFNVDTVDKVLENLMTLGQKVADGDRLGKTIVFAKNRHHANFIAERFNANYPHYKGAFARVITFETDYAQSLIDDFS